MAHSVHKQRAQTFLITTTKATTLSLIEKHGYPPDERMVLASSLMSGGVLLTQQGDISMAFESRDMNNNNVQLKWVKSPINPKRSNFQMTDAEKIYSVSFVTYLSRFLLSFDPNAQQWWRDRAKEIPKSASEDEIFALREKQFAQFAASVEDKNTVAKSFRPIRTGVAGREGDNGGE
eukprot:CAMPEP_0178933426 /NCGR_PEP_ID=MMETSP0786-20121207/23256_1 /TAXON_ID=186022 /ORGANISM="Thalassionema frauenfeldii, Strain CCMP 1798" /LENGTH=176 /DNA_ID=CAMNT_0020611007 /DNA_START=196 /DNA_END=726 /DNA_ORIENTATION=+